jgi:hypothetical protein
MRKLLAFIPSIILFISCSTAFGQTSVKPRLSDEDTAAIIKSALELQLAHDGEAKFKEYKILATDNIKPSLIPESEAFHFTLMKSGTIERKARRSKDAPLKYLEFGEFRISEEKVFVTLSEKQLGMIHFFKGSIFSYEFQKVSGQWQGKLLSIVC